MHHRHPGANQPRPDRPRFAGRHARTGLSALVLAGLAAGSAGSALVGASPAAAADLATATTPTTTVTLSAVADTYVVSSAPTANYGTRTTAYATTSENRAFLKFDTDPAVPANKKVVAATLRVFVTNSDVTGAGFEVHPASSSWTEAGLTYTNRPAHVATAASAATAVTQEQAWLSVPLTDLSAVSTSAATSLELLHKVTNSRMQIATREAAKAATLQLTLADVNPPQTPGVRPFDMPASSSLSASKKLVFAHYFTPFPVSLDNKAASLDYYTRNFLDPNGEAGKHAAYGGLMRDRPIGRNPLTGDYAAQDMETEIRQARSAGLDGFSVDLLSLTNFHYDRVVKLLEAAHRVDPAFKIMLQPDMTTLNDLTPEALAAGVAKLGRYPAAFHLGDGRLVVSPFKGEAKTAVWWQGWLDRMKTTEGSPVAFVPTLLDWQKYATEFAPISYGFSHWGLRNPGSQNNNPKHALLAHSMGKIWMAPAHVQDERPNQGLYEEAGNTETLRLSWQGVVNSETDWVNMPTWNDYSENTTVAPSVHHGWTYLDISSYYIAQWKNGTAPQIVRDGLYLTHRSQPYAALPSFPQTKLMKLRLNTTPARDTVEALAFLVAPGKVTVKVGTQTYTWDAPAGMSAKTFPLSAGQVSGDVARYGEVMTKVTSPFTVTTTPYVQDLQYNAVSSLRP